MFKREPFPNITDAIRLYGKSVKHPRPDFRNSKRICANCGKRFTSKHQKTCCSDICRQEFNRAIYWYRGRGAYATSIMYRDKLTCQICKTPHAKINKYGIRIPVTDGQLEIHHKKKVSEGGDNSPHNLITLCHTCHRELHKKDEMESKANG